MKPTPDHKPVTADQVLNFNPKEYAEYLKDMNLTPEQQDELIRVTANIIMAFVDMGFGISPIQTPIKSDTYKSDENIFGNPTLSEDDLLYLSDPTHEAFEEHVATFTDVAGEVS